MTTYTISLEQVRIFAHHGIHPEETLAGGLFELSLQACYQTDKKIDTLQDTLDYTAILGLVKDRMKTPTPLLESLCWDIGHRIKEQFPQVNEINITISKINPPVANFQGQLKVSWHKQF